GSSRDNMSHKGRNRDPGRMPREPAVTHKKSTALMEAQLESLKRTPVLNSSRRAINDFSPRLTPRSKRNSRPHLCEADVIAPIDPRVFVQISDFSSSPWMRGAPPQRIVNAYPPDQRAQVRVDLRLALASVKPSTSAPMRGVTGATLMVS